jgi:receptor expression-enhancing protein 5/6
MSISGSAAQQQPFEQYKQQFESICQDVDRRLSPYPIFQKIKESSGVRPAHAVMGVGLFFLGFLLFGLGANALTNLVGFIYPAYASFKALKTECTDDDKQWLTYWVVYAFLSVVDSITDVLMHWIPFYYFAKVVFLIWLFAAQTRGAERLYTTLIEPFLSKYEDRIDSIGSSSKSASDAVHSEYKSDLASGFASLKSKAIAAAASIGSEQAKQD